MGGQWYLLGKEIDHRFKIYYRANSSMERIVYRMVMGSIVMLLLFNLFILFPSAVQGYLFWIFFGMLGVFYSWPTRGKIIEESMVSQFSEIKFLDSFEKTVLSLGVITLLISLPEIPMFENIEAFKLYFDPNENVSGLVWNFLTILYYPFLSFPKLYNLIWSFHFYFFGICIFLLTFYSILRYFFSRRLGMLGVFAVLSTWSFTRVLGNDYFAAMSTTLPILWIWSIMWSTRSNTYRSGLFTGFVCAFLTMLNAANFYLLPISLLGTYFLFLKKKTGWFKRQWLKYNLLGIVISLLVYINGTEGLPELAWHSNLFVNNMTDSVYRKAFFAIAPIGFFMLSLYIFNRAGAIFTYVNFDRDKLKELFFGIGILSLLGLIIQEEFISGFFPIWVLAFFAIVPIEWVFQSISRLRSKRNIIYALYILVCLLDAHLENRFRIIGKMFLDIESFKYFIEF